MNISNEYIDLNKKKSEIFLYALRVTLNKTIQKI